MIDLHSHLLPGIDDGASSLKESLALARVAVADGISHMTLTPHIHPGRFDNNRTSITPVFEQFQQALLAAKIPLSVAMAGEVRLSAEVLSLVAQQQLPFLGRWQGMDVLLLELPHSHIPPGSDKLVSWLQSRNILPMIAHPERNKDIIRDLSCIHPFVELGCLFQVTAMSLAGRFGKAPEQRAQQLLTSGWITVLATDAHNLENRPPILSEGYAVAQAAIGQQDAKALVYDNPLSIING
jgi:protein-tyrosine phosphatase